MQMVKIKPDKYGEAIGLLMSRGEGFQTKFERTLIVTQEQRRLLEEAGFVAEDDTGKKTGKGNGKKAK